MHNCFGVKKKTWKEFSFEQYSKVTRFYYFVTGKIELEKRYIKFHYIKT